MLWPNPQGLLELLESTKEKWCSGFPAQTDQKIAPMYCYKGRRIHLDYIHNSGITVDRWDRGSYFDRA